MRYRLKLRIFLYVRSGGHCGHTFTYYFVITFAGVGSDSGEGSSKAGGSPGETSKQDTKNGKEPIHWHSKCVTSVSLLI